MQRAISYGTTRFLFATFAMAAAIAAAPAGAQSVSYDQGDYRIQTTLDQRFLGRYSDGSPIPDGAFLYEGQLRASPTFGIEWTRDVNASATNTWLGAVVAEPYALITGVSVQPVWQGYLQMWHALRGSLLLEGFSDSGYTNSLFTDEIVIDRYVHGLWGINTSGVQYMTGSFTSGLSAVYLRFTQTVSGGSHAEFASSRVSEANTNYFELSASAIGNPNPVTPIPEPETYAMLLAGLGVLALVKRRRRSTQNTAQA